ncbi:hypothetical protein V2J09_007483 [Rumex salicifolius]
MAANFDRWEKDPFFNAAEEVQESADRMESTYRRWLYSTKNSSSQCNLDDLRRDLSTALDTTKWQLEEFERAVQSSYKNGGVDEAEAKDRHSQFVLAMEDKISEIQKSLEYSAASHGKISSPRVQLDKGECDELALFLSGPEVSGVRAEVCIRVMDENATNTLVVNGISTSNCLKNNCHPSEQHELEVKDERFLGHRRTASASADISSYNLVIHEEESASDSSNGQAEVLPRRVPSFSTFTGTMDYVPKLKFPKNGFRKLKPADRQKEEDVAFLRSQPQGRGFHSCYERNKSCLGDCEDCVDKQLHGWYGALHRLLQRSLYQVQYIRSVKITFWASLLLFFIVLFLVHMKSSKPNNNSKNNANPVKFSKCQSC